MGEPIIAVEPLGRCYQIRHQQDWQSYVARCDVTAEKAKGVVRRS